MRERRSMELGDWLNSAVNAVIGVLLGSVTHSLVQLVSSGAWLTAVILVLLGTSLFLFMVFLDRLSDRLFPAGIRRVGSPQARLPKPLARVLSMPFGFVIGVVLAILGLDRTILDLLP